MRPAKVVSVVVGSLAALLAVGLAVGGVALVVFHATEQDGAGYYSTPTERFETPTYALVSERIDTGGDRTPLDEIGTARVAARSLDGGPVFVGIARHADVARYLAGSPYDEVADVDFDPFRTDLRRHPGERAPGPPGEQTFWVAAAGGPGRQTAAVELGHGRWDVVVMNADASPGVAVDGSVGVSTGLLLPVGIVLLAAAAFSVAAAAVLLYVGLRGERHGEGGGAAAAPLAAVGAVWAGAAVRAAGAYPVRLDGRLDEPLSRWKWLVKWFLAIPHVVVLAFLWAAFAVLTVVAGLAVLLTGRYPRAIFDFNVGVLRWTWRVTFYAFALATDRFPPFSLQPDPGYPADFAVPYPERLSRGLVLVKWWLLALPHYLVVALFGGGVTWWWWNGDGRGPGALGAGLIGLLVVVAAVALLFTGRYLRPVFDFVMGMYRWTYRVLAYAALLRDEYPPFRLDNGGTDPATPAGPAAPPPEPPAAAAEPGDEVVAAGRSER